MEKGLALSLCDHYCGGTLSRAYFAGIQEEFLIEMCVSVDALFPWLLRTWKGSKQEPLKFRVRKLQILPPCLLQSVLGKQGVRLKLTHL